MAVELTVGERWEIITNFQRLRNIAGTARVVGRPRQTVQHIVQLWQQTGDVIPRHRSGRPSLIRADVVERVANIIRNNRTASSSSLADALLQEGGPRISPRTMRRVRRQLGFHPVHEQARPCLTDVDMIARLAYAHAHRLDSWRYTMFADETVFTINNEGRVCWIQRGETRPTVNVTLHPIQVHVWGAVWYSGQSTLWIGEGSINAVVYTNILEAHLLPTRPQSRRYALLHDNARAHTARHTKEWLEANNVRVVAPYPPRSPDFNAIEHVWAWMKQNVSTHNPVTLEELVQFITEAWQSLPILHRRHYVSHIHTVMLRCIDAEGAFTD